MEAVLGDLAMQGSRFEVRVSWTPLSTAVAPSAAAGSSIAIGAGDAASCSQQAGRYRVRPGGAGLDAAEFLFAAGPSEPLRPLSAVASGGENARIMLALKAAPAFVAAGSSSSGGGGGGGDSVAGASTEGGSRGGAAGVSEAPAAASQILVLDEIDSGIGSRLGQPIGRILRRMAGAAGLNTGQILCVSHLPQVRCGAPRSLPAPVDSARPGAHMHSTPLAGHAQPSPPPPGALTAPLAPSAYACRLCRWLPTPSTTLWCARGWGQTTA